MSEFGHRDDHWNDFYQDVREKQKIAFPSQFAAFVVNELTPETLIVDIGCGNGRDSVFFARYGMQVISVDACATALKATSELADRSNCALQSVLQATVDSDDLSGLLMAQSGQKKCVYARFFLHAINDEEQAAFFKMLKDRLEPGDLLAFEYRTLSDEGLEKEAKAHFRRYQSADQVNGQLAALGFKQVYFTEGRGLAKYKTEDAVVARSLHEVV